MAVEPYMRVIEQLKERQREREAEIVVMRYALVEMDRKIQECEKRQPKKMATTSSVQRTSVTRPVAGASTTMRSKVTNSTKNNGVTTPRSSSGDNNNGGLKSSTLRSALNTS